MSKVIEGLRYADSHEWVKVEGDIATVGITDYAQHALGDIVYVDMPEVGDEVSQGEEFGAVESVKAASDLISPASERVSLTRLSRSAFFSSRILVWSSIEASIFAISARRLSV